MRRITSCLSLAAGLALVGCSSTSNVATDRSRTPVVTAHHVATPQRVSGSLVGDDYDRRGSFAVVCTFSHRAPDDPILTPGASGSAHLHDFFGATTTDSNTTVHDLATSRNTCDSSGDLSAYWVPTLFADGRPVTPIEAAVYYRSAPQVDPDTIRTPMNGLKMLSVRAGWTCARTASPGAAPLPCPASSRLRLVLEFPDCWDGTRVDAPDHRAHVAVSLRGQCPLAAPFHIPQVVMEVRYPVQNPGIISLSSGPTSSAHGDVFLNWRPDRLRREISSCVVRLAVCDLTWATTINAAESLR